MSYINNYLHCIWESILTNINGFYYFIWNLSPSESETNVNPDSETETTIQMKPIDKVHIDSKTIKKHIETLEFVLSKEINKDLSRDDLINLVKTEIQYINKKMSMSRNISQVNVEDIVAKTKLFNILQDIASGEVYIEQMMADSYYNN